MPAMMKRLSSLPAISHCKVTEKAMLKFYEGQLLDMEVVALFSGVCKVNAAIASQILIDDFGVNIIKQKCRNSRWNES